MNILLWIVFGGLAGWVASLVAGKDASMGIVANIVVGIIGAFIGGWIAHALGEPGVTGFNFGSFLVAVGGAIVLLLLVHLFTR
jgi:uncharacterized membrane protein YeaQ/YmgE (transglycosylase-associated protein family)